MIGTTTRTITASATNSATMPTTICADIRATAGQ